MRHRSARHESALFSDDLQIVGPRPDQIEHRTLHSRVMGAKETHPLSSALGALARVLGLALACYFAYDIRLYAVREYGRIIHEFDPWFNFRATQYLADNGWAKFSRWFDYMSWYPLGRPVGTTIYPGMQVTAVTIWSSLGAMGESFRMSLNDVCVFFPAWFGAVATALTGLLTAECSGDKNAAVVASLVMSIVPGAHHAQRRGRLRQREPRRDGYGAHLLRVVPRSAQRKELARRRARGPWRTCTWSPPGGGTPSC
jgi:hypothetical protein